MDEALTNYSECLYRFAEPIEQETLRTFIACIFVVASSEENPLGELSRLIQLQHTQQVRFFFIGPFSFYNISSEDMVEAASIYLIRISLIYYAIKSTRKK